MFKNSIKIISRKSALARAQAMMVGSELEKNFPKISVEYKTIISSGDKNMNQDLANASEEGIFTKDISKSIEIKQNDIAVHSWKDVPINPSKSSQIFGTLKRGDSRDILFLKRSTLKQRTKREITLLTSSPRRIYNSKKTLPKLLPFNKCIIKTNPIRGNIETRLEKFLNGDNDGIIIAKAAFDRMTTYSDMFNFEVSYLMNNTKWMILPLSIFPTAPGQGAIAIEAHIENSHCIKMINDINDKIGFYQVEKEKEILNMFGGGCHQKIGVASWKRNKIDFLSYTGKTPDGEVISHFDRLKNDRSASKKIKSTSAFPIKINDAIHVERKMIKNDQIVSSLKDSFIYLSRKNVLSKNVKLHENNILWTSGLKCWKAMAKKGYWINGSSESLGEEKNFNIQSLVENQVDRYKLSHKDAISNTMKIIPSYEITKIQIMEQLDNKTHFFWMSPMVFEAAIKKSPNILDGYHACGYGKTYDYIKSRIKDKSKISQYLSYDHWKEKLIENK